MIPEINEIALPFHIAPSPPDSSIKLTNNSVNPAAEPETNGFSVFDILVFCGPKTSLPPVM